jgi:hypothetical protein
VSAQTAPVIAQDLERFAAQIEFNPPAFIAGEDMTEQELVAPAAEAQDDTASPAAVTKEPVLTCA